MFVKYYIYIIYQWVVLYNVRTGLICLYMLFDGKFISSIGISVIDNNVKGERIVCGMCSMWLMKKRVAN